MKITHKNTMISHQNHASPHMCVSPKSGQQVGEFIRDGTTNGKATLADRMVVSIFFDSTQIADLGLSKAA